MVNKRSCPLFRKPMSLGMGKGIGYCDMDGGSTNCDADTRFCERPVALKQYLGRKFEEVGESEA